MNEPQARERLVVSTVSRDGAAISTDIDRYVNLTPEEWRWLIQEAGPKVVAALEDIQS